MVKIKQNSKKSASSDPLYDLFYGSYLNPHDFLVTADALDVEIAVLKIKVYLETLKQNGLLEEI